MIQRAVGLIPRIIAGSSLDDESGDFARMLADQEAAAIIKETRPSAPGRRTLDLTFRRVHHSGKPGC